LDIGNVIGKKINRNKYLENSFNYLSTLNICETVKIKYDQHEIKNDITTGSNLF